MNTNYKSSEYKSSKSVAELMDWLMIGANHEQLMPSEISAFSSKNNTMSYNLGGLAVLELELQKKDENLIEIHPTGKVPFPFVFSWKILPNENGSSIQSLLDAELNFMIKMAAGSKLQKLIEYQANRLQEINNGA